MTCIIAPGIFQTASFYNCLKFLKSCILCNINGDTKVKHFIFLFYSQTFTGNNDTRCDTYDNLFTLGICGNITYPVNRIDYKEVSSKHYFL